MRDSLTLAELITLVVPGQVRLYQTEKMKEPQRVVVQGYNWTGPRINVWVKGEGESDEWIRVSPWSLTEV